MATTASARPNRASTLPSLLLGILVLGFVLTTVQIALPAAGASEVNVVQLAQGTNGSTPPPARPPRTRLSNPLGTSDIRVLVARAIQIFLGVAGSLALLMFVYGGFLWVTSGGSPEKVQKGKKTFIWAFVGLLIMFSAYAILKALFQGIGFGN